RCHLLYSPFSQFLTRNSLVFVTHNYRSRISSCRAFLTVKMTTGSSLFLLIAYLLATVTVAEYDPEVGANICKDGDWQCAVDYTCCERSDGSTACCPFTLATCCKDDTCCPAGFACSEAGGECERIQ
ncbi:hypothetical protein PRIPAC_76686, partial [Pristionchus pacificus]